MKKHKIFSDQISFGLEELLTLEVKFEGIKLESNSKNPEILDFDLGKELDDNMDANLSSNSNISSYSSETIYRKDIKNHTKYSHLTREEEIEFFKRIRNGDKQAKEDFISSNLRLVMTIVGRFSLQHGLDKQDLIQEGNIGLIHAVDNFDVEKGVKFSTFAGSYIHGYILKAIENKGIIRVPLARVQQINKIDKFIKEFNGLEGRKPSIEEISSKLGYTPKAIKKALKYKFSMTSTNKKYSDSDDKDTEFGEILSDNFSVEEHIEKKEDYKKLCDSFKILNAEEKEIIMLKFIKNYNTTQISKLKKTTRYKIEKIINAALEKLKNELSKDFSYSSFGN